MIKNWNQQAQASADSAGKTITYLCAVIILGLAAVGFSVVAAHLQSDTQFIKPGVEKLIGKHRFLHTSACFSYEDQLTGRAMPRVIDLEKMTQERLEECYMVEQKSQNQCFQLQLLRREPKEPEEPEKPLREIQTANWVDCFVTKQREETDIEYVLIKEGDQLSQGIMKIRMMR